MVSVTAGTAGVIGTYWGSQAAEGFFHSFSGWIVFMACVIFFGILGAILRFLPERPITQTQPVSPSPSSPC